MQDYLKKKNHFDGTLKLKPFVFVIYYLDVTICNCPCCSAPRPVALVQRTVRCTVWTGADSGWTPCSVVSCTNLSLAAAVMSSPVPTSGTLLPGQRYGQPVLTFRPGFS